ncbi:hypothetical protein CEY11_19560 [Candidimonas nitroreducens]|uniref:Uncharacterized protein n=1 Tax=Candidimonas nitroreducens TaxID=683354 RepID=A0A225M6A9_9BURK|nr:hypothetical protein CEY11_19560 [Candidimonas nitroreducens]
MSGLGLKAWLDDWKLGNWEIGKLGNWEIGKSGNREIGKSGNREIGKSGNREIGKSRQLKLCTAISILFYDENHNLIAYSAQ